MIGHANKQNLYIDIDVEIYIICNCIGICEYNRAEPNAPPPIVRKN